MTPLEKDIERHLTRSIGRMGGYCLKWVSPGRAGVPDRIILLPGGRVLFAELKRPVGGRPSALQIKWVGILRKLGFTVELIYTHEAVESFLDAIVQSRYTGVCFPREEEE